VFSSATVIPEGKENLGIGIEGHFSIGERDAFHMFSGVLDLYHQQLMQHHKNKQQIYCTQFSSSFV
jgi:hypothetical protein